jgi:hypothetical protein
MFVERIDSVALSILSRFVEALTPKSNAWPADAFIGERSEFDHPKLQVEGCGCGYYELCGSSDATRAEDAPCGCCLYQALHLPIQNWLHLGD